MLIELIELSIARFVRLRVNRVGALDAHMSVVALPKRLFAQSHSL